jgi:exopolyphosphatase / guanosine-5'-triphosphate,3'-diphosphate pyrophosphatase
LTRFATIDLGTNTVRLLVADVGPGSAGWREVLAEQRVTRLGEGLRGSGVLGAQAVARTAAAVSAYVRRAHAAGAARIAIVATSAMREAANGRAFAAELERATGVAVRVISGDEEARLTLAGVGAALGALRGVSVTFDIGGGSTEYILAREGVLAAATSLRLGVVPIAERFPFPGPVEPERYARMRSEVTMFIERGLPAGFRDARVETLVGTAGTVTTLAALDLNLVEYDARRVQGHTLTRAAIARQADRLRALDLAGRAALPCLEPGRADLIVPGVAIVEATLTYLDCDRLVVSDWGLREGLLAELAREG